MIWSVSSSVSLSVWIRIVLPATLATRGMLPATTSSTAFSPIAASVVFTLETVNSEPPRNSMPRLKPPLTTGRRIDSATRTAAIRNQIFLDPTKSYERLPV
ncbi:hypothetical protein D9M73_241250 [compost metagenome]